MAIADEYQADAQAILERRFDNGADHWTTPDRRLCKGSPFSTLESAGMLVELGMAADEAPLQAAAGLFFEAQRDPRFLEALGVVQAALVDGQIAPQRVHRDLSGLRFCKKGQPSALATERYEEIMRNLGG